MRSWNQKTKFREVCAEFGTISVLYALEVVAQNLEPGNTNWRDSDRLATIFRREEWEAVQNLDLKRVTSSQDTIDVQLLDANLFSQILIHACKIDHMVSVLKALLTVATDIQKQYSQILSPSVTKLSKGVASLPDEILANIFEISVQDEGIEGAQQANSISHVSRRFRNIALAMRVLWTTLRSDASAAERTTFISRCGSDSDLHVFIRLPSKSDGKKWNSFMDFCWRTASRWRTFTFVNSVVVRPGGRDHEANFVLEAFNGGDGIKKWHLPRLRELDIFCNHPGTILTWNSPGLRVLRCSKVLPGHSAVFSSITSFSYRAVSSREFQALLEFVASMPHVTKLELVFNIHRQSYHETGGPHYFSPSTSLSVVSFQLRLSDGSWSDPSLRLNMGLERLIAAFMHALRLPNLNRFSVSVDLGHFYFRKEKNPDIFAGLSRALLPIRAEEPYTHLSTLDVKISKLDESIWNGKSFKPEMLPYTFGIPLDRIPTVSNITLKTCTRVAISRKDPVSMDGYIGPSHLREVRFGGCERMEIEDINSTIQSLKLVGAWDTLERIVVEDCGSLDYDAALELVGKDRLQYST